MKTLTEVLAQPAKTVIPQLTGNVCKVLPFARFGEGPTEATVQRIFIEDQSGFVPVVIGNHPQIAAEVEGSQVTLLSHKKQSTNQLLGVKVDEIPFLAAHWEGAPAAWKAERAAAKTVKVIAVSKSGEVVRTQSAASLPPKKVTNPEPVDPGIPTEEEPTAEEIEAAKPAEEAPLPPRREVKENPVKATEEAPKAPAGFRITEVRYDRTINTGNFCNEKIGLTAQLEPGEKASECLAKLKAFVDKHGAKPIHG